MVYPIGKTEGAPRVEPAFLEEVEAQAIHLAQEAGALLLDLFRHPLEIEYKSRDGRDPVSNADRQCEEMIRTALQRTFPDHGIVAEEGESQGPPTAEFVWVVDPLDGTSNFISHLPFWASSLGLLHRGRPVAGAVFVPSIQSQGGSIFHARLGGGAFQDGERIAVYPKDLPDRGKLTSLPSYFARGYRFRGPLQRRVGVVRAPGSTVYELAATAAGIFQYALFNPSRIWDVGAGILLVQEAGGAALTLSSRGGWTPLTAFSGRDGRPPTLSELQAWRAPVLAGNPRMVRFTAENIQRRPRYWLRLRRYLQSRWDATFRRKAP